MFDAGAAFVENCGEEFGLVFGVLPLGNDRGDAALALVKSLGGKQLIPTKVSYRTTAAKDATSAFQGKIDYGLNTSYIAWYAGGYSQPDFYVINKKLGAKGYRLVSDNSYRRAKSGMIVHCSIWHKN